MPTKFLYWFMGDRAARVLLGLWNWLWGIPIESGGQVAVAVAQESLRSMQESVAQLAESVAQVTAAYQQAKATYETKQREILPVIWHPKQRSAQAFSKQALRYWGGTVNWRTATAYDATQAIITGLQQGTTRDDLQTNLRRVNFSAKGSGEPIRFLPSGDRLSTPILVQVQPTTSGYDFLPLQ